VGASFAVSHAVAASFRAKKFRIMLTSAAIAWSNRHEICPNGEKSGGRKPEKSKKAGSPRREAQRCCNFSHYIAMQL
jgi:hypothetical protein